MKLSDLIKICEAVRSDHGDLDVVFGIPGYMAKPVEKASVEQILSSRGWGQPIAFSDNHFLVLGPEEQ